MFRTGILGFGGGPSVMPLFRHEAVNRYQWVKDEEFAEILAFANALPGPIATKMAAYLGYRLKGILGAVLAVIAHILPTSVAIIALVAVLTVIKDSTVVSGMIHAVSPVVTAMLAVMAYEFAKKAWKGLGISLAVFFCAIAFVLLAVLKLNAGLVVLFFLAYGSIHLLLMKRLKRQQEKRKEGSA
jgi:chromate transporter